MSEHSEPLNDYVKQLEEEVAREKARSEALVQEFRESVEAAEEFSPEDLKKKFNGLLVDAWEQTVALMQTAESESVRWNICKFIFGVGMGQLKITDDNDPNKEVNDLINDLINGRSKSKETETPKPTNEA